MQRERRPTIKEVARKAGVGVMTVSRVINDHPAVLPATRKRVETAIEQLQYQQNDAARQLKGRRAKIVGLIVPDLSDAFFASCAHVIQQIARAHGFMTLVASSERDFELEIGEAELMASRMISGLIIATSTNKPDERLLRLQNSGVKIVALDRPLPGIKVPSVLIDNRTSSERAVQHLIQHGHKRIACIGYDEDVYTVQERIQGYRYAMYSAGLRPLVVKGLTTLEATRKWLKSALRNEHQPTAIFALNHRTSHHILHALAEENIRIPKQMALIGFDDFDLASVLQPPLTVVAQSPAELAKRAIELLLEQIRQDVGSPAGASSVTILLPAELVIRASCGSDDH